jgi:glutamine amidotransferase
VIAIVDYGLGNVKAFANVYKNLNIPAMIVKEADDLKKAAKVILPGVGSFDHAMQGLEKSGMRPFLDEIVLLRHVPILGICVGMQMLACSSEEGSIPGLGWIKGEVNRFDSSTRNSICVPHMGWNDVRPVKTNGLFQGLNRDARFYFLHSYYFQSKKREDIIAVTDYGGEFACAVNHGNIFGVQFHPEKSHHWGILLLENFAKI